MCLYSVAVKVINENCSNEYVPLDIVFDKILQILYIQRLRLSDVTKKAMIIVQQIFKTGVVE